MDGIQVLKALDDGEVEIAQAEEERLLVVLLDVQVYFFCVVNVKRQVVS